MGVRPHGRGEGVRHHRSRARVPERGGAAAGGADRGGDGGDPRDLRHRSIPRDGHRDAGVVQADGGVGRPVHRPAVARGVPAPRQRQRRRPRPRVTLAPVRVGHHRGGAVLVLLLQAARRGPTCGDVDAVHVLHRSLPPRRRLRALPDLLRIPHPGEHRRAVLPDAKPVQHLDPLPINRHHVLPRVRPGLPHAVHVHGQPAQEGARAQEGEEGVDALRCEATITRRFNIHR